MFNRKYLAFSFLLLFLGMYVVTYASKIDSIQTALQNTDNDSQKIDLYYELASYYPRDSSQKTYNYLTKGLSLAKKTGYGYKVVHGHYLLGKYYYQLKFLDSARYHFKVAQQKAVKAKYYHKLAMINFRLCRLYKNTGNYNKAMDHCLMALETMDTIPDKSNIGSVLTEISKLQRIQKNLKKSLEYGEMALKWRRKNKDTFGLMSTYLDVGTIYAYQRKYQKALTYYDSSLVLCRTLDLPEHEARVANNKGAVYYHQKKYRESIENLKHSYRIHRDAGNELPMSKSLHNIGEVYFAQDNYKKAKEYFERSLAVKQSIRYKAGIKNTYFSLARMAAKQGDYEEAYEYHKKYTAIKDTLLDKEKTKQLAQLETKYQAKQKKLRIEKLNKQKQVQQMKLDQQRIIIWSVSGGALLLLLSALLIYNRFRVTRQQRDVIEHQKNIVEEKNEAISDSINYAKRIQSAILTAENVLSTTLNDQYFIYFRPKEQVSGDFYWAYQSEQKLIWSVVDCTGHGVPGAFMSLIGNQLLNEIIIDQSIRDSGKILHHLREGVVKTLQQSGEQGEASDGMDMALCIWDRKKNTLQYAGANNPLYLVREDEKDPAAVDAGNIRHYSKGDQHLYEILPDKQPVGYYPDPQPFKTQRFALEKGDSLYVFSDGYVDQFGGPKGKKFMYKRFKKLLVGVQDRSMKQQKQVLEKTMVDWMQENSEEQIDDICVMGIRVNRS